MRMRNSGPRPKATTGVIAGLLLCLSWMSYSTAQSATSDDPPDRVARVSYLKGDVSLKPAGTDDWAPSVLNRPLTTDDQLSLEPNARAELQAGSSVIQLNGGVAFSFSELSDTVLQARVTDGAIHLTVRRLAKDEVVEIDTPQAAITVTKPGDYRIEVLADGTHTLVKTYNGECQVSGNSESTRLQSQEQVVLDESGQPAANQKEFSSPDDFDKWAQTRNEQLNRSASSQYVAPDVIGYEDLDHYGEWAPAPGYGTVWYPHTAAGWSPYRDGHWAWVSPWGWTWVDNAPWGFAPFHYGRWAYVDARWGWVPGPVHVHAVYAPALVAWVGQPGFSMSISIGSNIGWFPLGPSEVYVPGYHCSPYHIHNVNYANTVIVNNTIINRAYVNRDTHIEYRYRSMHDAVTVVSHDTFVSARAVNSHMVHDRDTDRWQTRGASPAIMPTRASTQGPHWNGNQTHMPDLDRRANREVVTRHSPPPQRVAFNQEQRAIRDNNNRPVPRSDLWGNTRGVASQNNAGRNNAGANTMSNTGAGEQHRDSQFRDDHPQHVLDRAQEERRPNPQGGLPAATTRQDNPQSGSQARSDSQWQGRHESRADNAFHANDRQPGAQQEAPRQERTRQENSAPRSDRPGNNSQRHESRDSEHSRNVERSRPPEQAQPRQEPQQQRHPEQRQQAPQQAPQQSPQQSQSRGDERREQPHKGRETPKETER